MSVVRIPCAKRLALALAVAGLLAVATFGSSPARGLTPVSCPTFTVLHNDRIGAAMLPSGTYMISLGSTPGIECAGAAKLFTRFLEDFDGDLPQPWRVIAEGSGKASFVKGGTRGFSVARGSGGGGGPTALGRLCPGAFTAEGAATAGPLAFAAGRYSLYLPPRSALSCRRAALLFSRFLDASGAGLPAPWRVKAQTATFYEPAHPLRSAFRVEPPVGATGAA